MRDEEDRLPEAIEDEFYQAVDRPRAEWPAAVDALCARHAEWKGHLRRMFAAFVADADREVGGPLPAPADASWLARGAHPRELPSILGDLARDALARPRVLLGDVPAGAPRNPAPSEPALAKYRLLHEIDAGGIGVVYAGRDEDLGRDVALKFLQPQFAQDAQLVRRFVEEAQLAGQLQHPGFVPVYELGVAGEQPFFAMKLIEGETFGALLARRQAPVDDLQRYLSIFAQVCQAVAYAHARGVIHRDLKPSNVMIGAFGEVQVLDWGMGKVLRPVSSGGDDTAREASPALRRVETFRSRGGRVSLGSVGTVSGTPAYMSPEQAAGHNDRVDQRSDVFALGSILCEILTGRPAYCGSAADLEQRQREEYEMALHARLAGARDSLAACGADAQLVQLVEDCLPPTASARPADAGVVAQRVSAYLAEVEKRAQAAMVAAETERVRARAATQRQRLIAALAAVTVLGLVVALWLWRDADTARAGEAAKVREFNQLAGVKYLDRAIEKEKDLYPAWPDKIDAMKQWLSHEAGPLLRMRPEIERTVATLRARALQAAKVDEHAVDASALSTYSFANESQRFLHDTLHDLHENLTSFTEKEVRAVERHLRWAEQIGALTLNHPNAHTDWAAARAAIKAADDVVASKLYRDNPIDLSPQMGLVPIGMNPKTKLWEFYDLRSAWGLAAGKDPAALPIPKHDLESGHIAVANDTGIVFVLVPGGTFTMGAQSKDRDAPNYDERARDDERPHSVTLAPFFLARHELTQGQWLRLTGGEMPSQYRAGTAHGRQRVRFSNPVEHIDWHTAERCLSRQGMVLPTEAQWEYGCRAGTTTPWWTGLERESLRGAVNVADKTAKEGNAPWSDIADWPDLEDGFVVHAPVDALRPNAFGLHHVHGNLWEWCRDAYGEYSLPTQPGDGLRQTPASSASNRVARGGSFNVAAGFTRSAYRGDLAATFKHYNLGLRAARRIRLDD